MANNYESRVENSQYKIRGLVPFYYRSRNCDTNLTANTPANQYQRVKIINNTTGVASSLYAMNIGALTAYKKPLDSRGGVCWNQMSDRPVPSVQKATVPTGYNNSSNRRHGSVTSSRPGGQTPGGVGCDVKHNSYDRYLNRLKGKGPLRRGSLSNLDDPLYGGKNFKPSIVEGCDCPIADPIDNREPIERTFYDGEGERGFNTINPQLVTYRQNRLKELIASTNVKLATETNKYTTAFNQISKSTNSSIIKKALQALLIGPFNAIISFIKALFTTQQTAVVNFVPETINFNRSAITTALLIGINYNKSPARFPPLQGCINDANNIYQNLSIGNNALNTGRITKITDEPGSTVLPTEQNILDRIIALVDNRKSGDRLFFHYSGHGSQSAGTGILTESDGKDEFICSCDGFYIRDDTLRRNINLLPTGVTLFAIFDCCHSGTICDLKYRYDSTSYTESNISDTACNVVVLSGCTDPQLSIDMRATSSRVAQGALTWAFLETIKTPKLTWRMLLTNILSLLRSQSILNQTPVLSSGRFIDIDTPFSF